MSCATSPSVGLCRNNKSSWTTTARKSSQTIPLAKSNVTGVNITSKTRLSLRTGLSKYNSIQFGRLCTRNHARSTVSPVYASSVTAEPDSTVLVIGATGGVGQLTVANLLERGYKVRAMVRTAEKAAQVLGTAEGLELIIGDSREASVVEKAAQGVDAVVCCTGTTAFPSKRWDNNSGPEQTDFIGVKTIVDAVVKAAPELKRFILVSSVGVTRTNQMPYIILNLFGVLKFKAMGEAVLKKSGLPYTILRPGRLTDGPYTSYDINTLLKATSGSKRAVEVGQGDTLTPQATSRLIVAEACVQALTLEVTSGEAYELGSEEGEGPGSDAGMWEDLFVAAKP